jgi:hypothetical protein
MTTKILEHTPGEAEDIVIGGREQLFHLLAEAAEVEHTLMCSYLYAAFSLRDAADPALRPAEAAAVARWRERIVSVAVEEMAHLLLVANLTIAIGGRPHFGRPNFPVAPGYFPADVVVRLAPFSARTLEHFVFLERPADAGLEDAPGFEPPTDYEREEAYHGLMPSVQDYATVGELYEALRRNLRAFVARRGEAALIIGPVAAQVGHDVVALPGVATITGLDDALAAIDAIVEQGEGAPRGGEASHFERFRAIQAELAALRRERPGFEPAWPAAENPVMRRPPEPEDKVFVRARPAAAVLDLANAVYTMLLQLVLQSFGRTGRDAPAGQRRHLDAAIGLMHELSRLGALLARLPADAAPGGPHAGVSFTMLRSVEPFFLGEAEARLVHERLDELARGATALAARMPELHEAGVRLAAIRDAYAAAR